jgi:hypothetical protein
MPVEPEPDLAWQAFLYVSGDLSASEVQRFEDRLLDDQSAREAVASAVELIQAVGAIGRESTRGLPIFRPRRKSRSMAIAILLASAALVIAAFLIAGRRNSTGVQRDGSDVALAWPGLHRQIDADWKAISSTQRPADLIDPSGALDGEETTEPPADRPLPSWLLSAASVPQVDPPHEDN